MAWGYAGLQQRIQYTAPNDVEATEAVMFCTVGYALQRLFHWWLIASLICWCTFAFGYWLFSLWLMVSVVYWFTIAVFFFWNHYLRERADALLQLSSWWFKTGFFLLCCNAVFDLGFGWFKWWVIASMVYWIASGCAISRLTRRA